MMKRKEYTISHPSEIELFVQIFLHPHPSFYDNSGEILASLGVWVSGLGVRTCQGRVLTGGHRGRFHSVSLGRRMRRVNYQTTGDGGGAGVEEGESSEMAVLSGGGDCGDGSERGRRWPDTDGLRLADGELGGKGLIGLRPKVPNQNFGHFKF
jgi:hypothetical protein